MTNIVKLSDELRSTANELSAIADKLDNVSESFSRLRTEITPQTIQTEELLDLRIPNLFKAPTEAAASVAEHLEKAQRDLSEAPRSTWKKVLTDQEKEGIRAAWRALPRSEKNKEGRAEIANRFECTPVQVFALCRGKAFYKRLAATRSASSHHTPKGAITKAAGRMPAGA